MESSNLNKVTVNNCFYCEGSWIDANEIKEILSSEPKSPKFNEFSGLLHKTKNSNPNRLCPSCDIPLNKSIFKNIELDSCPDCNGIFFDRDEVKEVAPSAKKDLSHLVPAAYAANEVGWLVLISFFSGGF